MNTSLHRVPSTLQGAPAGDFTPKSVKPAGAFF